MPGNDADLHSDLALLEAVAREAGALAKTFFDKSNLSTWEKSENHPVSEADIAVNELIFDRLLSARPAYGWLSEESPRDRHGGAGERTWIVDPIDGTRAFIKGDPYWCIGLGLLQAGKAIAGIVHAPILGQSFAALKGAGATLNGTAIQVSTRTELAGCRMIGSAQMFAHPAWPEKWPDMDLVLPKPNATLLRMCHVASGQSDATIALAQKSDWDLAAGEIIVSEAGGLATTHLGEAFLYNRDEPAQRSLLVSGKGLHSLLVERMKHVRLPDPNWAVGRDRPTPSQEL